MRDRAWAGDDAGDHPVVEQPEDRKGNRGHPARLRMLFDYLGDLHRLDAIVIAEDALVATRCARALRWRLVRQILAGKQTAPVIKRKQVEMEDAVSWTDLSVEICRTIAKFRPMSVRGTSSTIPA